MSCWTQNELAAVDAAQELTLAPARGDGTLRRPVTMWVVRIGEDVYVRSVNGRGSAWFRGAQTRHEARIRAGGIEKDVSLVETDEAGEQIDAAYQTKRPSLSDDRSLDRRAAGARHDAEAHTTRGGNLMHKRTLGENLEVSAIGLGCMGMSTAFPPFPDKEQMVSLIRTAVDHDVTLFDTAQVYGPFSNEELVGEALEPVRDQVVIATKFGFDLEGAIGPGALDSRPDTARGEQWNEKSR